jgi:hypothetical protein
MTLYVLDGHENRNLRFVGGLHEQATTAKEDWQQKETHTLENPA